MPADMKECICCKKSYELHKMLECCVCKNYFNYSCADVSMSEVRCIKAKKSINWTCLNCTKIGNDMSELKAIILKLKEEVSTLSQRLDANPKPISEVSNFEEIIQEVTERENRKCNIIFFGVDEIIASNKDERISQEKDIINNVFSYLSVDIDMEITPVRLGKYDRSRSNPRPIKIKLEDTQSVYNVMRLAKNLRDSESYKNIHISQDRTPRQITYYKSVKSQMEERIRHGESNLRIKYVSGIPKIVSSLN